MRYLMLVLMIFVILSGCSLGSKDSLMWFSSPDAAIQNGIKLESINESDLLSTVETDGETLLIFKQNVPEGTIVGVASLSKKDGQFAWYRENDPVLVKRLNETASPAITCEINTQSKKTFYVYLGVTSTIENRISLKNGSKVQPSIDKNSGIYYYVESANDKK
ncbi:hypothetical protein EDM54_18820 [Brevibacillus borstelensis]|uniref:hypothetical protein n=2 Tax=Brevibacillus TaxID=55080 RepID=UPI00046979DB|nr:hypothetical protein [Brevibacillus borstelensis]MCC0563624.1 hypothetical protein [Brevibacillus borstelensis]MCM3469268.1 hypothetical protein [Brevibacillus borstelensis]MCM3558784.1 hypothetical protein [Brevibacillus borstelensis]MCM3589787.1 hypothetical protein [Brevibacillus borstelensis]MCM3621936.1 hypothetical protein [Brevibacillus borstelensis]